MFDLRTGGVRSESAVCRLVISGANVEVGDSESTATRESYCKIVNLEFLSGRHTTLDVITFTSITFVAGKLHPYPLNSHTHTHSGNHKSLK